MSYMKTVASITLASGLVFQLPVVVYFLSRAGLLTPDILKTYRRHALVAILILSALITPRMSPAKYWFRCLCSYYTSSAFSSPNASTRSVQMRNPALRLASAFAALVLTSTVSSAQVTEVRGRVFDALTGEALPYVNVVLGSGENGTMTDAQGQYTLATAKRPGRLSVTFLGYASQSFAVVRGISQQINISLEPRSFDLGAAEVRPNRKEENPAKPLYSVSSKPSLRITPRIIRRLAAHPTPGLKWTSMTLKRTKPRLVLGTVWVRV